MRIGYVKHKNIVNNRKSRDLKKIRNDVQRKEKFFITKQKKTKTKDEHTKTKFVRIKSFVIVE